jgi:Fe-S-cluster containining protein
MRESEMTNKDMRTLTKLKALDRIYAEYDRFSNSLDMACKKYCAHCCTSNVTLTTLEGYKIVDHLTAAGKLDIIDELVIGAATTRYQPQISTNRLAELYAAEAKVPEEEMADQWQECSLLEKNACAIYDLRPFGCRCFISRKNCAETGFADTDEFTASVNTVFLQTIEHLDADGCSGNLIDVLQVMASGDNRQAYAENCLKCEANGLIVNWSLKVLMIPPEHRTKMEPILQGLRNIKLN